MFSDFKNFWKHTHRKIYSKVPVMGKRSATPKSRFYTTLWCIVHHNTCFRLFLFFWHQYFTRYCSNTTEVWWDILLSLCRKGKNLLLSLSVKEFWKWLAFGKVRAINRVASFFRTRCRYYKQCSKCPPWSMPCFVSLISCYVSKCSK